MLPRHAATSVFLGHHSAVGETRIRSTVRKGFGVRSQLPNRTRIRRRMRLSQRYCIYDRNITSAQFGSCGTWRTTIRCASPMPQYIESSNGTVSIHRDRRCNSHTCAEDYTRHTQKNAIAFVDHIIAKFPFRIQQIRTDRGHEFQAQFHWHVEDQGIRHAYIKPRTPQLNGKVERSHRSDQEEFYQLLSYKDDVDLNKKLDEWEQFYNFARPHGAHQGRTPYESLREKLT